MSRERVVIVGGGAAGCVAAFRLSESPHRDVLLLEAGPDYGPAAHGGWPENIATTEFGIGHHDWGYTAQLNGAEQPYPRGKVMGGSAATNGGGISRPLASDFDTFAGLGIPGWGHGDIEPAFQRVERLVSAPLAGRGRAGMLPFAQIASDSPFLGDVETAMASLGLPATADVLGPATEEGFGRFTRNVVDGRRWHAAAAYLDPARRRPNLRISANTTAIRVIWAGSRAAGVLVRSRGRVEAIGADEVVLAAGAIGTPVLLERSGIGETDRLAAVAPAGPRLHLSGVGENLRDHCGAVLEFQATPHAFAELRERTTLPGARNSMVARVKSSPGLPAFDLEVFVAQAPGVARVPDRFLFRLYLVRPDSVGSVHASGPGLDDAPAISLGFGVQSDIERLAQGIEWSRGVAAHPQVARWIDRETAPGPTVEGEALRRHLSGALTHYYHPVGTCQMGGSSNPAAVVAPDGRLRGLDNLSIWDASVLPRLPAAQPLLTVLAAAEHLAAGWSG